MTFPLPKENIVEIKNQCLSFYKASEVSLLDLTKLIGIFSSTIQAVLPGRLQFRFLQQQQILSLKQTHSLTSLWWSWLPWQKTSCYGGSTIQNFAMVDWLYNYRHISLFRQMHPKKGGGLYVAGSEQGVSGPRGNRVCISISWNFWP